MKRIYLSLIGLFLIATVVVTIVYNHNRPRVLVLHSYDNSYPWTRDVSVGVRRVLDDHPHLAVRWFFMDTKRHPAKAFKEQSGLAARKSIDRWRPDVLIAIDDDAQQYVASHYVGHPQLKVVFAGVNGGVEPYGYAGADNVSGILERKALRALKETLLELGTKSGRSGPWRLVHIGDTSGSVDHDEHHMEDFDWAPLQRLPSQRPATLAEWQAAVLAAQEQADFIVTTNYRRIARKKGSKELVPPEEIVAWTVANSRIPVVGTNGFFVEDGGELAIGTSPYEQGEVAARMALRLLDGASTQALPHQSSRQFVVHMRSARLRARGIELPPLYESFAQATNSDLP